MWHNKRRTRQHFHLFLGFELWIPLASSNASMKSTSLRVRKNFLEENSGHAKCAKWGQHGRLFSFLQQILTQISLISSFLWAMLSFLCIDWLILVFFWCNSQSALMSSWSQLKVGDTMAVAVVEVVVIVVSEVVFLEATLTMCLPLPLKILVNSRT